MAILITGGCGYIGSHTAIEMTKAGYEIVILDNFYNSKPEALRRLRAAGRNSVLQVRYTRPRTSQDIFQLDRSGSPFCRTQGGRESVSKPLDYETTWAARSTSAR